MNVDRWEEVCRLLQELDDKYITMHKLCVFKEGCGYLKDVCNEKTRIVNFNNVDEMIEGLRKYLNKK